MSTELEKRLIALEEKYETLLGEMHMLIERRASDEGVPVVTSPAVGSVLDDDSQSFTWVKPGIPSSYYRAVGSSLPQGGGTVYFDSGNIQETTYTAFGLPLGDNSLFLCLHFTQWEKGVEVAKVVEFEYILSPNIEDQNDSDTSVSLMPIFGDGTLDASEVLAGQNIEFIAVGLEGVAYTVELFNTVGSSAAVSKNGTITAVDLQQMPFTYGELSTLTGRNSAVRVTVPSEDIVAEGPFLNISIDAPDAPTIAPSFSITDFPYSIPMVWIQDAGESLSAVATPTAGLGVNLVVSGQGTGEPSINLQAGTLADDTYDLTITATNGIQTSEVTVNLVVDTAVTTTNAVVVGPTGTLTNPNQTVTVTAADPALYSYFLDWYTDQDDFNGSKVGSEHVRQSAGVLPLTQAFSGLPMTGNPLNLRLTEMLDDGSGGINWGPEWRRVTDVEYQTQGLPAWVSPNAGSKITDPQNITFTLNGHTDHDSIRVKTGRTSGASDLQMVTTLTGQTTVVISGHDEEANVYLGLYTVKNGVETLRDERRVSASSVVTGQSGIHNNVGIIKDSGHFTAPPSQYMENGRFVLRNKHNLTFENFHVTNPDMSSPWNRQYKGAIHLIGCTNITLRNFYVTCPESTRKRTGDEKSINACVSLWETSGVTLEDFNTHRGWSAIRGYKVSDITVRRGMLVDARQHYIQCGNQRPSNVRRLLMENCYMYSANDRYDPYEDNGAQDPINMANASKGGSAPPALIQKCFINSGRGLHGSGGAIIEGPDYKGQESNGQIYKRITCLDSGNKFMAHAGGNGGEFHDCWGYQDDPMIIDPIEGMRRLGRDPNNPAHVKEWFTVGAVALYHFDYFSTNTNADNKQDNNFGEGKFYRCRTHWKKSFNLQSGIKVLGLAQREKHGTGTKNNHYATPYGNEAYFEDCQFDADSVQRPINPGEIQYRKNWEQPCITRAQCVERGKEDCADVPLWTGFTARVGSSMYHAGLNGET